jgi:hypothetical protein
MLRNLQGQIGKNVDATKKSGITASIKRGTFVQKAEATKTFVLPTAVTELYIVDRDTVSTTGIAMGEPYSEYDVAQDAVANGEFAGLVTFERGERWATSEYDTTMTAPQTAVGSYLTVGIAVDAKQGKLVTSATATPFKSCGLINDNGNILLSFEVVA